MAELKTVHIAQPQIKIFGHDHLTDNLGSNTINSLVFEQLLEWHNGSPQPKLIQSWDSEDGGYTWKFALRPDAIFHDGEICTVRDIFHTLEHIRNSEIGHNMKSPFGQYLQNWEFVETDPFHFTAHSPVPTGDLLDLLCDIYIKKDPGGNPFWLGTGPYRIMEQQADELTLESTRGGSANQRLVFHQIPNVEDRYQALLTGEVDIATELHLLDKKPETGKLTWRQTGHSLSVTCFLNGFEKPFDQPAARLAVNLAVNVEEIIHEIWDGLAIPATTVVSPFHFGYPENLQPIAFQPEAALRLFDECELPSPIIINTPLIIPDRAKQIADMIKHQLTRLGIPVAVVSEENRSSYAQNVGAKKPPHMAIFDSSPHSTFRILQEKISGIQKGTWWQGVSDDTADSMIEKAHHTGDLALRRNAYEDCLVHLNNHPHWLYLYHPILVYAHKPTVTGMDVDHFGVLQFKA